MTASRLPLHGLSILTLLGVALIAAGRAEAESKPSAASEGDWWLDNGHFCVVWDASKGVFSLGRPGGTVFGQLRFDKQPEKVQIAPWQHARLGPGRAFEVALPDGETGRIILLPELPFVLLQKELANDTSEDQTVHHVRPFEVTLDLPDAASDLKALGTAGLTAPNEHPGSYAFLAVAAPKSRRGVVSGWLSHDRGSGVVFSDIKDESVRILPQIDYGCLRIRPNAKTDSEIFAIGLFDDARLGLEAYADAIAQYYQIRLRPIVSGYCTWYSSPHGGASDEVHVTEFAKAAAEKLKPCGFDFVQIDDKWQDGERRNGPAKNFHAHKPDGPYPSGMKNAADQIKSVGLVPGIWFMPFAGDRDDPFYKQHQDWFVKRKDGTPYWARWGGTSLDMTNPDTQAYVRSIVRRIAHDWGYGYFKMDGLWTGTATELTYVNNGYVEDDIGEAVFHDADKTNIEAYRDGFKLVREAAGPDVFFLGCCASQNMRSFGGSFGLVDAMRIGPDNGTSWTALCRGPWHGTNRYFLHGRVWYNDPDPVYVRPNLPLAHARLICSWVTLSGQLTVFSEWLPNLPDDRVDLLRRSMPNHGLRPRPVDLFENELARVWLLTDTRREVRRDVIGLFNWDEHKSADVDYSFSEIGLPEAETFVGYDYWADRFVPPFSDRLRCTLPGGSCRVIAVRPECDHPQLVSTSRHITQGIVDVLDETWDADSLTLRGRSQVVAADPYELRILVPTGAESYRVVGTEVAAAEGEAQVKVTCEQTGPKVRVRVESETSLTVAWSVKFRRAAVDVSAPQTVDELKADVAYHEVVLKWKTADATTFRVTRNDGRVSETTESSLRDTDFARGTGYRYTIQSVGWDGRLSDPASVEVTTVKELVLPPVPPKPNVSITSLTPVSAKTGWGKIGTNRTCEGNPLRLLGKTYQDGMGVHANSTLIYTVPDGAKRLVATVGLDDEKRTDPRSSVVAAIHGDADEMGERPALLAKSPVLCDRTVRIWHFDVPLSTRIRKVHLIVTDADGANYSDHADWLNTGFVVAD